MSASRPALTIAHTDVDLNGSAGYLTLPTVTQAISPHTSLLERFVEEVRVIAPIPGQAFHVERYPDGRTSLVFRLLDGRRRGDLWVAGPHTRALFKSKTGVDWTVIVRLKPGWSAPLLGVAANELTDQVVPLQDLWGRAAADLCAELLDARSEGAVLNRVRVELTLRAERIIQTASAQLARRAVALLEEGEPRVERVAERLGVTERHLRRAFTENVGIGPKAFARTIRLQRALDMAATSCDWARIAADAGYFDQAHLIGDFRRLVGTTPGVYFKRASELRRSSPVAARL